MKRLICLFIAGLFLTHTKAQSFSAIAKIFVATLDDSQKTLTLFPFESEERYNFHYFPIDDRKGLPLDKMTGKQKSLTMQLLS